MSLAPTPRRLHISLFITAFLALGAAFALHSANAANSMPLTGYAWSPNIGWISFNGPGYEVLEDKTTGALSGYAWVSDLGWISFNASDASHILPGVDLATGKVYGWARACAAFVDKNTCSGALESNSGGWDGWISLAGMADDGSIYGFVQGPTCTWTGYAWGSGTVGAISASGVAADGSSYGVSGNVQSVCSNALVATFSSSPPNPYINQQVVWSSTVTRGSGSYTYSWSGTDGLTGTSPSAAIAYTTNGDKQASLMVTDTITGKTASGVCTNCNENNNSSVTVNSCTATLTATPGTVVQGQNTTLSWSVPEGSVCASSCTGSGFNTNGAISGSATPSLLPAPPTTSYALTCTAGTGGPPPPVNTIVTVITPTITSFTINNQPVSARVNPEVPNNVTIAWSTVDTTSCSVTKNGSAWRTGLNSAGSVDSVTVQTTYRIDCSNDYGSHATSTVIANVPSVFQEF